MQRKEMTMAGLSTQIQDLYVAYFGRPADYFGLQYWTKIAATPSGFAEMVQAFATSAEYQGMVSGMDNRALVDAVYEHLFGRAAETAGVDYWAGLLDSKVISIADVVTSVAGGAQGLDSVVFQDKVQTAEIFTDHLDQANERLAYTGTNANTLAHDYLAAIKDEASAAYALDPANIDALIAKISTVIYTAGMEEPVHLVGVQPG
jgi:hypothetical protein